MGAANADPRRTRRVVPGAHPAGEITRLEAAVDQLDACRRRGFEPVVAARSGQIDFVVELAAMGLGVAFLPRMIAEQRCRTSVRPVLLAEPQTDWRIAMVWRRGGYLSHAAKAWLALVRETYAPG